MVEHLTMWGVVIGTASVFAVTMHQGLTPCPYLFAIIMDELSANIYEDVTYIIVGWCSVDWWKKN